MYKIAVVGIGYVGMALSVILSKKNEVIAVDVSTTKVEMINNRKSPIKDELIDKVITTEKLNLQATVDWKFAYSKADFILICVPTDFDKSEQHLNTSLVEKVIEQSLSVNKEATVVIKSTVPIGFTEKMCEKFQSERIIFCPEFLREGQAYYDNLYPSRIIIGCRNGHIKSAMYEFAEIIKSCSLKEEVPVEYMRASEAEAVKLFSNAYLALRVAFFNELDTFAESQGLSTINIIKGMAHDTRIGSIYNNPSFGYGGYCLPKDTKQLLYNYGGIPQKLISSIVEANDVRKKFIAKQILKINSGIIGVYRLIMKTGSDNYRSSSVIDIIETLKEEGCEIVIYEPVVSDTMFMGCTIIADLEEFKEKCDLIIANRNAKELDDVKYRLYTRDIFFIDE